MHIGALSCMCSTWNTFHGRVKVKFYSHSFLFPKSKPVRLWSQVSYEVKLKCSRFLFILQTTKGEFPNFGIFSENYTWYLPRHHHLTDWVQRFYILLSCIRQNNHSKWINISRVAEVAYFTLFYRLIIIILGYYLYTRSFIVILMWIKAWLAVWNLEFGELIIVIKSESRASSSRNCCNKPKKR